MTYFHGLLSAPDCNTCPLRHDVKVAPDGPVPARLAIVGEDPGDVEKSIGRGFVGPSGKLLWDLAGRAGISRDEVWVTNSRLCKKRKVKLSNNATLPEATVERLAAKCCHKRLLWELKAVQPAVIIPVGNWALRAITGIEKAKITAYRGSRILLNIDKLLQIAPQAETSLAQVKQYAVPTIHPAMVLRTREPITDVIISDLKKADRISKFGFEQVENLVVCLPTNPIGIERACKYAIQWMDKWIKEAVTVAVDVETSSLDYISGKLYSIALSGNDGCNTAISFSLCDKHTLPWRYEQELVRKLRELLCNKAVPKCCHNAPFDLAVLYHKGFEIQGGISDTMAMHHLIQPNIEHTLGAIGHTYLDVEPWKLNHEGAKMVHTESVEELLIYNAKDALNTAKLINPLMQKCEERSVTTTLLAYQNAFSVLATRLEIVGMPVNMEVRKRLGDVLLNNINRLKEELRAETWDEFNPMNKNHVIEVLFSKKFCGLEPTVRTEKTGVPSTRYEDIIEYIDKPLVRKIVECIQMQHSYAVQYRDTDPVTGKKGAYRKAIRDDNRLHAQWNPTGTTGSRFSSKPNCYDAITEVLTVKGWLTFPTAMKERAKVLQFDPATRSASITDCTYLQTALNNSDVAVCVETDNVDLRVTGDHRMLIRYEDQGIEKEMVVPAAALLDTSMPNQHVPAASSYYSSGRAHVNRNVVITVAYCLLYGHRMTNGDWFVQCPSRFLDGKLRLALDAMLSTTLKEGYCYRLVEPSAINKPAQAHPKAFRIQASAVTKFLDKTIQYPAELGPWLLQWNSESLSILVETLHDLLRHQDTWVFPQLHTADWIQIAGLLTGHLTGTVRHATGPIYDRSAFNRTSQEGYKVGPNSTELDDVTQGETFYCGTVPKGFLFIRRNGKACICGNCQNQQEADREFFEAPPGRVFVGADLDQLELRLIAVRAGVCELLDEMRKPNGDPHTLAAMEVFGRERFLALPPVERKLLRDGVKTTVYASLYRAIAETVFKSIRRNKKVPMHIKARLTLAMVKHIITAYFGKFVEINEFHEQNYQAACKGYIEIPPFGRRLYFPVQPPSQTIVANWPTQVLGSDIATSNMVHIQEELDRKFTEAYIIGHFHDALAVECRENDAEAIKDLVGRMFGSTVVDGPAGPVTLTCKPKIGKTLKAIK